MNPVKFLIRGILFAIGYTFIMGFLVMLGNYSHSLMVAFSIPACIAIIFAVMAERNEPDAEDDTE